MQQKRFNEILNMVKKGFNIVELLRMNKITKDEFKEYLYIINSNINKRLKKEYYNFDFSKNKPFKNSYDKYILN